MLKAKICGLTKDSEIKSCIEFGAAFCGFILNWPKSHRYINIDKLRSLTKIKIKSPEFVGVLVNPTDEEINIFSSTNLQYFQLHGEENIDRIKEIKQISKKKIIKTIKVNNEKDIEIYEEYKKIADIILFDSFGYESSQSFEHKLLKKLNKKNTKWMIAGNIGIGDLENVAKIADYVDVSGSLETNKEKDLTKIKDFLLKIKNL
tara:strand:+ start:1761 stop:2372 length:612 start_codon:yes stop_codon:yes gene_type:complete